jgi:hypothetical protein
VNAPLQRLRAELRFDRDAFANRMDELRGLRLSARNKAQNAQAAVALHHGYGSIEATMERIARQIDGDLPRGGDWHQALLHGMGLDIEGVRPALFSRTSVAALREVLGFRNFFRHACAVEPDAGRLRDLRRTILGAAPRIHAELDGFDAFLAPAAVGDG